jgi:hypothetical protein
MPQIIADNLIADGYRVMLAPDRTKAIALLTTVHPDLILGRGTGGSVLASWLRGSRGVGRRD